MFIKNKSLIEIHLSVFLFGLAGLFGKLISLPPMIITFGRVVFSSIFLFIIIIFLKKDIKLKEKKHYIYFIIMGIILAVHWSTFFKSIQVSTVAVGLITFSSFPVFVTFLEPFFFKERIKPMDILMAFITFFGVYLVVPKFQLSSNTTQGILYGIASGFTYAVLSVINKKYVKEYSGIIIAFYEQFIAALVLMPLLFIQKPLFQLKDVMLLILLGTVFTAISHTIFITSLKNIKAQTASIISCLEPVYGILFAAILLKEIPTLREIAGGIIILSTVFYSSIKMPPN